MSGQYIEFKETGIVLKDTARVKNKTDANANMSDAVGINPTVVNNISMFTMFRNSTTNIIYFPWQIPNNYELGTPINLVFYWSAEFVTNGVAEFRIFTHLTQAGTNINTISPTIINFDIVGDNNVNVQTTTVQAIAGVNSLGVLNFRIDRTGASPPDTFIGPVQVSNIEIQYISNKLGKNV